MAGDQVGGEHSSSRHLAENEQTVTSTLQLTGTWTMIEWTLGDA